MTIKIVSGSLQSQLIPDAVEYSVALPEEYDKSVSALPLLIYMHGGGLDHTHLASNEVKGVFEKLWSEGLLPPMVVACYNARGSWHLNYYDKSELWEDFAFEFIHHMQRAFNLKTGKDATYLSGISMGAMGALRLTLKYPDKFGAVVAQEGIINPVLDYDDLQPRNYGFQHNLAPEEQAKRWGWPVDHEFYKANNHANIVQNNAENIRKNAPKIYLECGDRDYFNGHDGAEFLHRMLWDHRIEHEYRLLHDCDHVGSSMPWRIEDAMRWLGRTAMKLLKPEAERAPKLTKPQLDYLELSSQNPGKIPPPNEEQAINLTDDAAIAAHRMYLPEFITKYADKPLDGVFRKK